MKPLFHSSISAINEALEEYPNVYISESRCFLKIEINEFISRLDYHNRCIISSKQLYNKHLNKDKTDEVLKHWKNQEYLMPPTIDVIDDKFRLIDGTHRINAAHFLGSKIIPVGILGNGIINMKTPILGECEIIGFK